MDYRRHITRDPKTCGGQAVMAGTRVPLRTILNSLAEGAGVQEILIDFPSLKEEHVWAAICFAASAALEDFPLPEMPNVS